MVAQLAIIHAIFGEITSIVLNVSYIVSYIRYECT